VDYSLGFPQAGGLGRDLIRSVTRNLLATDTQTPESESLLTGVQSMTFSYFDGTNWNDSWSSTLSNIPCAVRVSIDFVNLPTSSQFRPPIQLLVPVVMNTNILMTNSASSTN